MNTNVKAGPPTFKLVLLGDGRVGKTSLVLRYVNNVFSDSQAATIQASYLTKRLNISGTILTLSIWDTAGQERFHALGPIYYRDADAALLVYDIMDKDSFTRVRNWVKELRQMASKNIILAIAANKSDLVRSQKIDLQEAERSIREKENYYGRAFLYSTKERDGYY
uniref:Ras-related protein Rab-21 n=1 Tax=Araucaria cunninghamii TaxID=56994 RepID=A0A0D6QY92_ARACU